MLTKCRPIVEISLGGQVSDVGTLAVSTFVVDLMRSRRAGHTPTKVLLSIQALLSAPEPTDPLDTSVADHFIQNRGEADAQACGLGSGNKTAHSPEGSRPKGSGAG